MNRIILVGNGFDLAHNLPTSYKDFINDCWKNIIEKIKNVGTEIKYEDDNLKIFTNTENLACVLNERCKHSMTEIIASIDLYNRLSNRSRPAAYLSMKNKFLETISSECDNKDWVDIENQYYKMLKNTAFKNTYNLYSEALNLNNELSVIESLLKDYLIRITSDSQFSNSILDEIEAKIYSDFKLKDISYLYKKTIISNLSKELDEILSGGGVIIGGDYSSIVAPIREKFKKIPFNNSFYNDRDIYNTLANWNQLGSLEDKITAIGSGYGSFVESLFSRILQPDKTIILDFNYTNTTSIYERGHGDTEIIHIHGELNNERNRMIFGYGDELGEDYKKIEDLEENELLKNVKSIRYQDTNNYRKLMEYVDSDIYEIFIMGHSCGNSDRTMLNTLFEHENCISIKPFYYQKDQDTDNYSDIVRNISRNFTNKPSMRSKVVNKTLCKPLVYYTR
jgi:hypothetical protein